MPRLTKAEQQALQEEKERLEAEALANPNYAPTPFDDQLNKLFANNQSLQQQRQAVCKAFALQDAPALCYD
jgi:hypothetical protein